MKKIIVFISAMILSLAMLTMTACDVFNSNGDGADGTSKAGASSYSQPSVNGSAGTSVGQGQTQSTSFGDSASQSGSQSGGNGGGGSESETVLYRSTGEAQYAAKGGDYPMETSKDIYLSPFGNDTNPGTLESPCYSLSLAVDKIVPGSTIFMLPGYYEYGSRINLSRKFTEDTAVTIQALYGETVVLDFSSQPYGFNSSKYVGLYLTGDYWKIQGLTICHAGDNGIKVEGSHNYIGRCVLHHCGDTGIQLGFGHSTSNPNGENCAYNTIENCDSYLNYDFDNHGDADGFACKMHNGKGNIFIGCRAWRNCDDAWDLFETDWAVEIVNCWAWESGNKEDFSGDEYFSNADYIAKKNAAAAASGDSDIKNKKISVPTQAGNGNGIKTGGNGSGGNSKGTHIVYNCVSFGHDITSSVKGFDENNHKGGVIVEHCVGWDNGYSYMFEDGGSANTFKNNIAFYINNKYKKTAYGQISNCNNLVNNNFVTTDSKGMLMINASKVFTADDFITLDESAALAPRKADGSLPDNGFAKLKSTSKYYGTGMGLLY